MEAHVTALPDHPQSAKGYPDVPAPVVAQLQEFRSRFAEQRAMLSGTAWSYLDGGSGPEAPLLLLTGAACFAEMSWRSIEHFAQRRRVIAPDYPAKDTMVELVDGIAGVLDHAGVERAHVLGGSYGGFVAQAFVRRHPDRTVSLILSHALLPDREGAMRMAKSLRWMRWLPITLLRTLLKLRLGKLFPKGTNPEVALSQALFTEILDTRLTRAQILSLVRRVADLGLNYRFAPEDLRGWPGRLLLLLGDDDPATPPPARTALAEMYPRAEVRNFVGAGHLTAILKQDEYFAAIDEFLNVSAAGQTDRE